MQSTTIGTLFSSLAKTHADRPAFTCMGKTLTYRALDLLSDQFATYLQHHTTLAPGDRLAIQLPNILQYPVVLFAAMKVGVVVVNTNPLYTGTELSHQLNDSGAKVLVTFANLAKAACDIIDDTHVQHVIITEVADCHNWFKRTLINGVVRYVHKAIPRCEFPTSIKFRHCLSLGKRDRLNPVKSHPDDLAFLQYTGGTTGVAKGAMLSHNNLLSNMNQVTEHWQDILKDHNDCFLAPLPLYHIYAFTLHCLVVLKLGCSNVLIPNPRDIKSVVRAFQDNPITGFVGLNTLFVALCKNESFISSDFSNLRFTTSGGMALTQSAAERWQSVTGILPLEGYGMTETSPVVSINQFHHNRLGTIGTPVPDTQVKVINEAGETLAHGEAGELCIKGPQVMKGYWNKEEATQQAFTHDGWLKSGDIAIINDDGFIQIVDRKKDMIIVSGFNVYPAEVETVILEHKAVVEVAVIGCVHTDHGESIKAFVVLHPDITANQEDIRAHCKLKLTGYKIPAVVVFMDELPKSAVGKVLRRALRDQQ